MTRNNRGTIRSEDVTRGATGSVQVECERVPLSSTRVRDRLVKYQESSNEGDITAPSLVIVLPLKTPLAKPKRTVG